MTLCDIIEHKVASMIRLINDPVVRKKILRGYKLKVRSIPAVGVAAALAKRFTDDPNVRRVHAGREVTGEISRLGRPGMRPTTLIAH